MRACTLLGSTRMVQPRQIRRRPHRPHAVGDVAEAVLEPAEDAVVDAFLDLARERLAQRAVHGRAGGLRAREQERQVDDAERRHPVGQVARRLVAERQQAVLDQPQDVLGAVAEVHDVPDIFDLDAVAELGDEAVADELERAAETGAGGTVASHADL